MLNRLLSKTKKTNTCWIWLGAKNPKGYGRIKINKKLYSPHRIMFELFYGKILGVYDVCHKCDNPSCINPDHLFLGTRSDNMKDAYNKGRLKILEYIRPKGSDVYSSKLKERDIFQIRELDKVLQRNEIAKLFNVHKSQISRALNGQSFKHIK